MMNDILTIYMCVNLIDGKRYIGCSAYELRKRVRCHLHRQPYVEKSQRPFAVAVRKYGPEFFRFTVIKHCASRQEMILEERRLIEALRPEYNTSHAGAACGWKNRKVRPWRKIIPDDWCLEGEEWRPIPGYEGLYEASIFGRVRAMPRNAGKSTSAAGGWPGRILTGGGRRYPAVSLSKMGRAKGRTLHSLVAETFLGPRPEGMQVCHKDDDKKNSSLTNLYYGTPKQNGEDKVKNNKAPHGMQRWNAKLTDDLVRKIREDAKVEPLASIARRLGVSEYCATAAVRGLTWKHVE